MKKIEKDLTDIPLSLTKANTERKRQDLISRKRYIRTKTYDKVYKQDDIKSTLKDIYNNKCAYCEQIVEQPHIEHYRPKVDYYWLAYSWDNLMLTCPTCNQYKGDKFEISGKAIKKIDPKDLKDINIISSSRYDPIEQPKMINPERTNPESYLKFKKDGEIYSDDKNCSYTINTCKLNRKYLNDYRKEILDDFRNEFVSEFINTKTKSAQKKVVESCIKRFIKEANNPKKEYLGFRNYAIKNNWLNDIIKGELKRIEY